jgi:hypothetical protein
MKSTEPHRSRISVLVPVGLPAEDLLTVHRETLAEIEKLGADYEFLYLVGSASEALLDQIHRLQREDPERFRVLRFGHPTGEAAMLTAGIERAKGEIVFTVPPRFEVAASALAALHEAVESGADLAFASRASWTSAASARLQSRIFNKLISGASGTRFTDITCATRAMRRAVLEEIPLYGDFHRYLPVLADRLGFAVREVPASQHPSKVAPLIHAPRLYLWRAMDILSIFFLSRFTRRPLRLFGGVGSLFGAAGAGILLVVGTQRLLGTPLANRPILVLGTLLLGLGVQAFTIGLLGELIIFFHARNIRDYRIAAIHEADEPPLPKEGAPRGGHLDGLALDPPGAPAARVIYIEPDLVPSGGETPLTQ